MMQRVRRTLPDARASFVAGIARDTPGTDGPRLVKVLDTLLAWSAARSSLLAFRAESRQDGVLAFERAEGGSLFWSASLVRGAVPMLELCPPSGRSLRADDRAAALRTLNAHSRAELQDGDRLRIRFGALKNDAARAAVLSLMKDLLTATPRSADA